jgi:hypothetical protein
MPMQQNRSHFLAHLRGILEGERGGDGAARVAIRDLYHKFGFYIILEGAKE